MRLRDNIELPKPVAVRTSRADLSAEIVLYWRNRVESIVGLYPGVLENGRIVTDSGSSNRQEVAILAYESKDYRRYVTVFVEADGTCSTRVHEGVDLTDGDRLRIRDDVSRWTDDNAAYMVKEKQFAEAWDEILPKLNGLTPDEAIALLARYGF